MYNKITKIKKRLLSLLFTIPLSFAGASDVDTGLTYLNMLRAQTGLNVFVLDNNLAVAAQNHSDYMEINNLYGHYESDDYDGFTGVTPADRCAYADYASKRTGENISYRENSIEESVDGLFSAIYHRFGFLSLSYNEIGIGINSELYTYDMGNTHLDQLCREHSYSSGGYYYNVCNDKDKKIEIDEYELARDKIKMEAPEIILWPPVGGIDIPPVFYGENPDPLPDDGMTGYPISIEFNDYGSTSEPSINYFTCKDIAEVELDELILMSEANDPNGLFSAYQFAFFPKKRLEWGSLYNVEVSYNYNGETQTLNWCFSTRSLESQATYFYRIENNKDISLNVKSGETYAFYIVPDDTSDNYVYGVSWTYATVIPDISYIDSHTFTITLTGDIGQEVKLTLLNDQHINLTIDTSHTAIAPLHQIDAFPDDPNECQDTDGDGIGNNADGDDDGDGLSDDDEALYGLDPLDGSDVNADDDGDGITNIDEIEAGTYIVDCRKFDLKNHQGGEFVGLNDCIDESTYSSSFERFLDSATCSDENRLIQGTTNCESMDYPRGEVEPLASQPDCDPNTQYILQGSNECTER